MAFLLSRLCSSAPRRLSVAFAAAWFLATSLSTAILGLLPDDEVVVSGVALLLTSITCLVAGIYVLVRRKHVRALFEGRAATGSRPR